MILYKNILITYSYSPGLYAYSDLLWIKHSIDITLVSGLKNNLVSLSKTLGYL